MAVPPKSIKHPDYGFSAGRGAFKFVAGKWMRVTQRVKVNGLGKEDGERRPLMVPKCTLDALWELGEVEVFIDGKSVIFATGLVIRTEERPDGRVQGLHLQTFFGGTCLAFLYCDDGYMRPPQVIQKTGHRPKINARGLRTFQGRFLGAGVDTTNCETV